MNTSDIRISHKRKQAILSEYQKLSGARTLIETGTYYGNMIDAQLDNFDKIISIELSGELYEKAVKRFINHNVELYHGDSSDILPEIMKDIKEPVIFWLDGHYSAGVTAKGSKNTPIREELTSIINHHCKHIILIDDAREFTGDNDYPTLQEIENMSSDYKMIVEEDIIRLT